jgi:hypothetical protein
MKTTNQMAMPDVTLRVDFSSLAAVGALGGTILVASSNILLDVASDIGSSSKNFDCNRCNIVLLLCTDIIRLNSQSSSV